MLNRFFMNRHLASREVLTLPDLINELMQCWSNPQATNCILVPEVYDFKETLKPFLPTFSGHSFPAAFRFSIDEQQSCVKLEVRDSYSEDSWHVVDAGGVLKGLPMEELPPLQRSLPEDWISRVNEIIRNNSLEFAALNGMVSSPVWNGI